MGKSILNQYKDNSPIESVTLDSSDGRAKDYKSFGHGFKSHSGEKSP